MNKWLALLLGLVFVIGPIYLVMTPAFAGWGAAALELIKGGVVIMLVMIGIGLFFAGISDLKA